MWSPVRRQILEKADLEWIEEVYHSVEVDLRQVVVDPARLSANALVQVSARYQGFALRKEHLAEADRV